MKRYRYKIPPFKHKGGDWWISSMERMWFFVAIYATQDWERDRPSIHFLRLLEELRPVEYADRPVATGGNPPKRVNCAPYCKCAKHYNNIVPPEE